MTVVGIAETGGHDPRQRVPLLPLQGGPHRRHRGRWLKSLEATIADIADAPDPADDKLERLIQARARAHRDLLAENRHLFDVYCTATETSRALVRKHRARLRQLLERVLDEGIATGKFDPGTATGPSDSSGTRPTGSSIPWPCGSTRISRRTSWTSASPR